MNINAFPSVEECKAKANGSDFKRLPVTCSLYSDKYTPVQVIRKLKKKSKQCFLLESAEQDKHFGRWSILGFQPSHEITLSNGSLCIKGIRKDTKNICKSIRTDNPNEQIRELLADFKSPKFKDLPFTGGLVGCFSYDYFRYSEPVLKNDNLKNADFFDLDLLLFDRAVVFDHYKQEITLIANIRTESIDKEYAKAMKILGSMRKTIEKGRPGKFEKLKLQAPLKPDFTKEQYMGMVTKAKQYIKEGDIFQVVLSNPQRAAATGSLFDVYRVLRSQNPSPYMFYFTSPYTEIAGASPETLVKLENGTLHTFPLAGTRKRPASEEEDAEVIKDLLSDEKERAEHNMLVDLGRNDIGKISEIGTVKVPKYMDVVKYSHVMHIASEVTGRIMSGKDALDAVSSILPAGTLSGAPKIRACQIIDELEGQKRGIYAGAIGYIDFQGNLDTAIAIRLAYMKNGNLTVQTGAGIVADSIPEKEAEECVSKARATMNAVEKSNGGLE